MPTNKQWQDRKEQRDHDEITRLRENNAQLIGALGDCLNALLDYVPRLEANGASLNYGHSVIARARSALSAALGK